MLAGFAALSYTAVRTKSATADEPLHALGAYLHTFHGDFRLNCEDPPLWKYWAMLSHRGDELRVDFDSSLWKSLPQDIWQGSRFVVQTMYRTPGNDPDGFINRSRALMLIWGVALGVLIVVWAWELAGPWAAIMACALYCFDPNFLGHTPLVKDDVAIALAMTGLAWAIWRAGRRLTVGRALGVALFLAVGLNVKFSGVLLVPITCVMLLLRAWFGTPWRAHRRELITRRARALIATGLLAALAITSVISIWACYGFRFAPTREPGVRLDMSLIRDSVTWTDSVARDPHGAAPNPQELSVRPVPFPAAVAMWMNDHQLLPQAWLAGFMDTYKATLYVRSYLLGHVYSTGTWYYFPLAMLFKTPVATLVALLLTLGLISKQAAKAQATTKPSWDVSCLLIPGAIYLASAMGSAMNLGIRHVLPVYPLLFVFISMMLAPLWNRAAGKTVIVALGLVLATESLRAHPNYIAFFNAPSGGPEGGFRLLGDSNLDWGQDLRLLADWKRNHPDERLYVSYFGMADPGFYLGSYAALPGNSSSQSLPQLPREPGVLAISASNLRGIYLDPPTRAMYRDLYEQHEPMEVLGGTIYLYRFDQRVAREMEIE
jgi:4-amino-4-deoxy-L-arabinose transferase-like glycosyltransferase